MNKKKKTNKQEVIERKITTLMDVLEWRNVELSKVASNQMDLLDDIASFIKDISDKLNDVIFTIKKERDKNNSIQFDLFPELEIIRRLAKKDRGNLKVIRKHLKEVTK